MNNVFTPTYVPPANNIAQPLPNSLLLEKTSKSNHMF